MNQKLMNRMGALVLVAVMLLSLLSGPLSVLTSAEEVPFGVAFDGAYAKAGEPMTVTVSGASGSVSYSWTVDGKAVSTEASYTPTEDDLMKWIAVTVTAGKETATAEMFFSKLPVVYINTENGAPIVSKEDYIDAELIIQGNETYNSDTTTLYNGVTEIRGRGNSTWSQPKKPYKLKLDKKTDVFGMGKNKHWVLLANYLDESLLRNTLAYDLSGNMGMNQMSTVFVDVILNGDFIGNYQFCEQVRVDGTRVDVFDWEGFCEDSAGVIAEAEGFSKDLTGDLEEYMLENMGWVTSGSVKFNGVTYTIANYPDIEIPSIDGGYLLELDEYYDEISKFKTEKNQPIMFKNPEFVNTNADMMAYVKEYIQAFENAVSSDSYTAEYEGEVLHYSELFDFQSLMDYWLINEIFFNEELNKKSTYMYKEIGELVHMGPIWDMDWSSGGEGQTYHTENWATRHYSTNAQANSWYKSLIQDPYFFIKAQERYWEIRNDQVEAMLTQLDESYELLKESAAANGKRWGYGSDYKKYVDDLRNWFTKHLTWLDAQMATQDALRDSLGYHPSSRLALKLQNVQPDYSKLAPADAIAAIGQELKLVIEGGSDTTGTAVLYVNGRRVSETPFTANSSVTVDVPAESLTAEIGDKNVLEVQIEKADGTINASRYITVIFGDHEHEYEAVVTAPTCTEGGYTTYTCACGDSYVDDKTEALGHTEETVPGTPATFDDEGTTDGVKCAVCGITLVEQETSPKLDYNEGIVPVEVLVATTGDWQTGYANEGPAELVLDDDFSTIWHTDWKGTSRENHWIQFELKDDYTVDGLRYKPRSGSRNGVITEYAIQISDDGVSFETIATGEWASNSNWKVAQFDGVNAKYVRLVSLNSDGDNPNYVFASAAEIRLTGVKVGAHEHVFGEWIITTEPTCTEKGEGTRTCECGESETREIPALGHTEEVIPGKDATCTETGLTEGKKCSVCGEILVAQEVVPALGHDFVNGECSRCEETLTSKFEDVPAGAFYFDPVAWAVEKGITTGATETTFNPNGDCQRAQVVTFLWRAAGSPEPTKNENPFTDVKESDFYYKAVLWAVEKGITNGLTADTFGPFELCNRAQVVTFLWRAMGSPASEAEVAFTDVVPGQFYSTAVAWAVENGITNGISATEFGVGGTCNRAQVVTFLYRTYVK